MERDFLGLSLKEPLAMVKDEVKTDEFKEIGFSDGSGAQWPFTNKVSADPQLFSFKVAQEDMTKNIMPDRLDPSAFMSFSNASVYESNKKHSLTEILNPSNYTRQDGSSFSLNACLMQHDVHSMHRSLDTKMFAVANHSISNSMGDVGNPLFSKTHYKATGQSVPSSTTKPQLLGGVPVAFPHLTMPTIGPGSGAMVCGSSAQLTIFYAGTVNVYDDISHEKAQAIMFLAGNRASSSSNMVQPNVQVQMPSPKPAVADLSLANRSLVAPPCSRVASPVSVSSQSVSSSIEEVFPDKTIIAAPIPTPISKLETQEPGSVKRSTTITMMPSVPQARKASLARFLEKRRERVMNVAPYNVNKKSVEGSPLNSIEIDVSATSAAGTTIPLFGNQRK